MPDPRAYDRLVLAPTELLAPEIRSEDIVVVTRVPYCPRLLPTYTNTTALTVLPIAGIDAPFTIDAGLITFDSALAGYLLRVTQVSSAVNGQAVRRLGRNNTGGRNVVLDGCGSRMINGDLYVDGGLVSLKGDVRGVCGVRLRLRERMSATPRDYGLSFDIFVCATSTNMDGGLLMPSIEMAEIMVGQLSDYRGLYASIRNKYSIDYASPEYINISRGQVISQEPSDPYVSLSPAF